MKRFPFSEKSNKSKNFANKVRSLIKSSETAGKSFFENYSRQNKCITTDTFQMAWWYFLVSSAFCLRAVESQTFFMARAFWQIFMAFSRLLCHFPRLCRSCIFPAYKQGSSSFFVKFPLNKPQSAFRRVFRWFSYEPKFIADWENIKIRFRENFRFLRLGNNQIKSKTLPCLCLLKRRKKKSIDGWCVKAANQKTNERQNVRKTRRKFKVSFVL